MQHEKTERVRIDDPVAVRPGVTVQSDGTVFVSEKEALIGERVNLVALDGEVGGYAVGEPAAIDDPLVVKRDMKVNTKGAAFLTTKLVGATVTVIAERAEE